MKLTNRQRLMASTLLFGTAGLASPALAQQDPAQVTCTPTTTSACPDQSAPVSSVPSVTAGKADPGSASRNDPEIVVTGSRIARRDLTSTSPLAVVKAEEFALTGSVNVEQVINTLPQVIPGTTAFSNNPGGGVATLNLRGLGSQRNLVLVNGRRYIFFDANQVTDLNTIPSFLLDSVDVVTGGASAVYGSDALAGVTNFHLRTDLKGLLVGGEYALTQKGDGARYNAYAALGGQFADGKGYATLYGEYYNRGSIFQDARTFSRFALGDGDGVLVPGGSANVPQGRFTVTRGVGAGTAFASSTGGIFATPGVARPYNGATDVYNYAPANYLMVPQKRWSLGGYGEYEVAPNIHAYGEFEFINNRVVNQLAATPITQGVNVPLAQTCLVVDAATCSALTLISTRELALNAAAVAAGTALPFGTIAAGTGTVPALTPGFARLTANYRVTQISNRISTDDRNAYRFVAGLRGGLFNLGDFKYDLYYSYARTKNSNVQDGNISRSAFVANVANGNCNIFGANLLSQDCIDAVSIRAQNQDISTLQVTQGSISGNLFTLPWATNGVGLALGGEYRKTSARFIPDTALSSGDVVGFNAGQPTQGGYNVKEVFGELRVPIIENGFISRLELNGAARYSKYSLSAVGGVWTYAGGAEFAPIRDITFRGQYQRAIRAPNVAELFGGNSVGFPAAQDPCAQAAVSAATRAVCIATGVPAAAVGTGLGLQPNTQIESAFGGNPNLKQEIGDTWTLGAIIRPRFIPRLNIAIDGYKIRVKNVVSAAGGGTAGILDLCYNTIQDANSPICQLIHRDPNGVISGGAFIVQANNANLSELDTKGVDLQVDYSQPLNFGLMGARSKVSFFFMGNYTKKADTQLITGLGDPVRCAGRFGNQCGQPTPKYKWTTRVSWMDGPLTSTLRWRHLAAVRDDDDTTQFVVERLPAYNLFDLAFSLNVTDHATMNLGINNLLNKKPPILGAQQEQANTFPSTYDVLGRDFFVSAQFRF